MKLEPPGQKAVIHELANEAEKLGLRLYAVGGCVRDWVIGRNSSDIDFLTSGSAEKLAASLCRLYGGTWQAFEKFHTVRCFTGIGRIDLARFRKEIYPSPASLPQTLPAETLEQDLRRRDFTVNAMAVELTGGSFELTDLYNGLDDIKAGIVRVLHKDSFFDDPTRIYRAARFAARFGWQLAPETAACAAGAIAAGIPARLSRERIRNELFKILSDSKPCMAMEILNSMGALDFIFPKLKPVPRIEKISSRSAQLAVIASNLDDGAAFIASLRLSKKESREIFELSGLSVSRKKHSRGLLKSVKDINIGKESQNEKEK